MTITHPDDRVPYLSDGAEGCRLSAEQDRKAVVEYDPVADAQVVTDLLDSASRWDAQAARIQAADEAQEIEVLQHIDVVKQTKSLAYMADEIATVNRQNGWYDDERTLGEAAALIHSEISEALDAYRKHLLEDMTKLGAHSHAEMFDGTVPNCPGCRLPKPEGVGSELADVFIRALDNCYRLNIDPDEAKAHAVKNVVPETEQGVLGIGDTFGDAMNYLHVRTTWFGISKGGHRFPLGRLLVALDEVCDKYGIDLLAEYERKHAFNQTRGYRHGGRHL